MESMLRALGAHLLKMTVLLSSWALGKLWAAKSPSHSTPSSWTLHEQKLNYCAKHLIFLEFTHYSTLANIQIFFYYFYNFIVTIKVHLEF